MARSELPHLLILGLCQSRVVLPHPLLSFLSPTLTKSVKDKLVV